MSLEVTVKEEPAWETDRDSRDPLANNEVKSELVTSPEVHQPPRLLLPDQVLRIPQSDEVFVKEERERESEGEGHVKTEPDGGESPGPRGVSEAAARAGLYADHVVKDELVLGPERLQPRDAAFSLRAASEQAAGVAGGGGLFAPRDCSVRFERCALDAHTREPGHHLKSTAPDPQEGARKKPFSCDKCHKKYSHALSLKRHLFIHSKDKHISCEVCGKIFTQLRYLNQHRLIHTPQKGARKRPFSCDKCHKTYSHALSLKRHLFIHSEDKHVSCEVCDKIFTQLRYLNQHKLIHTGHKPYSCEICKKQFSVKGNLKKHILIHTGQKPYSCEICKKEFRVKSHLNEHKFIHTGDKPHSCEVCDKIFRTLGNLNRHKLIHTRRKPIVL